MRSCIGLLLSAVFVTFTISGCGETKSTGGSSPSGAAPMDSPTKMPDAPPPPPPHPKK